MKHAVPFIVILLAIGLSCVSPGAQDLPAIPPSDRILTTESVKNFWLNTLQQQPVPAKPTGLHPEQQAAWQQDLDSRASLIRAIRNGDRNTDAKLAELRHNATAWRQQGNGKDADAAEAKLREIQEHLARLETLEIQRKAAQSQIDAAETLKSIAAEIAAIRECCN
ncbi:MAG: hypothetical protein V4819_13285 [Verrucomicrobiota bacterium]